MPGQASVTRVDFGGCVIMAAYGHVDVHQIRAGCAAAGHDHIVLDLRQATAIHPSAASAVASVCRRVHSCGGTLCIVTAVPAVRARIEGAALTCCPRFFDDIGEALEASMTAREAARTPHRT
ncbi:STAS domain-containing protein [Phytoactinopolyspora halotolerans]|uniref:STAS domain-containing protein n=1 Tax=Phytoactinopolyspora halotolerans TaxID=1981512 RepID=A0A6L9SDT1_9ACTN|nr:STAS domain-containing protein [Phytoactinopolyspora halotolerans]NEE03555.1 STAS domain-containing protein [Phytoactinopolyspora halotolerans]